MGTSLNVDVTKFMWQDMGAMVSILEVERQSNDHVLLKMLEEGLHSDITLTARGGSVKAHRCVLSAVSPVFRAMFQHGMKEQLSSTVDIPDMTIEALQLFLLLLYTLNEHTMAEVPIHDQALPCMFTAGIDKCFGEFFEAVAKYQVLRRRLKPLLEDALGRNISPDNCWVYYDIALQFSEQDGSFRSIVRKYIVDKFHSVLQSENFLLDMRHDPDRVYSILLEAERLTDAAVIKALASPTRVQEILKKARGRPLAWTERQRIHKLAMDLSGYGV